MKTLRNSIKYVVLMVVVASCGKDDLTDDDSNVSGRFSNHLSSTIIAPPSELNMNGFYTKYLNIRGIPVLSSDVASDEALYRADSIMEFLLVGLGSARNLLISSDLFLGVIGDGEVTTDFPELHYLASYTDRNWDEEPYGYFNANPLIAVVSEANLMCLPSDGWNGATDLTVHEFAHPIDQALRNTDPDYRSRVEAAYTNAMANGLWTNTYAASNNFEYLAEGVQRYYNVAAEGPVGGDAVINNINTRTELQEYDPTLFSIIAEHYNPATNPPVCNPIY